MKTISVELPERTAEEIENYVRSGWFASSAEAIRTAVLEFVRKTRGELTERQQRDDIAWALEQKGAPPATATHRPIEEVLAEIASQVPDEEWAKLPADLNDNLDHYLYGAPKR
jgi:Arc/MetJ-type ribon-helix-helix transcriptional regulator